MGAPTRLHQLLQHQLAQGGQRPFMHLPDGRSLSFADLDALAGAAEAELRALDVRAGDRVLVVAENCPEHAALILACSRVGAWSCGVNARMAPAEVDAFAASADARVLYFTASASGSAAAHAARHAGVASVLPGMQHGAVRAQARAEPPPLCDEVAALIFTSGTTGAPKGVMVSHAALLHFARVSAASRALREQDRCYAFVPMTHVFGLATVLLAALHAGAQLVLRPQFEPADLLDALARHGVSQLQGPPALFSRLLAWMREHGIEHPPAPALRYLYTGAGPLDATLKHRVEAAFDQTLHHGYGLSEYAGSVHLTRLGEQRTDTSVGYAVEGGQVQVTDPASGRALPAGERGELWIRGAGLMHGYFRDAAATAAAMRPGGWYASGDLGELHVDGALFVVGRLKEMIIRSGFNVYPAEVERALNELPGVQRSAVVGRPAGDGNEEVIAFVELQPGATLDEAAARARLRQCLAPYKQPARIAVLAELPTSPNGKVLKRQLQQQALQL
ncbi:Acyl-CoA synthetase (AMP-forming)/AMP-acid ligase II [Oryzisolibacter propanilivorax]|uniref:Acyl-CoA synthetase (AMP-forming)/AMP-acid ligase II n=1 Tax=Oryzisolibacter propanilivorax TaxID=1527607 RepID=A0A1G9QCC4_9BURK|nr:class I adenylate-forming enzyme family protein [Oryzisolibacter propanilivorax]SDM08676.1 Acyl-CoA synthetase (AMP-forming)/AMP-acid ligase II [Oryzisolibacter propanilivorax]